MMESYPKVTETDSKLILRSFTNNLNQFEFLTSQSSGSDYVLQNISDLKAQLSWIRSKFAHLKSWVQKGDDKLEEVDINELESKVVASKTKFKICDKAAVLYRDTCLYTSFIQFQEVCEDGNQLQIWERQSSKLLSCATQLADFHRVILYHTQKKNEALRSFITAKTEFMTAHDKYESILQNRREAIEDNEDNEVFANVMLQDKINKKHKQIKVLRHIIHGLVGLAWISKSQKPQTVEKLLGIAFDMGTLPPLQH